MERRGRAAITRHKGSISRATQILGTRIKTWGWMTELASCLRERENIFLRERRLVLVVNEDRTYDKDVTEEMLSILGCSNGAQVDQYLKQVMVGHNVKLDYSYKYVLYVGLFKISGKL